MNKELRQFSRLEKVDPGSLQLTGAQKPPLLAAETIARSALRVGDRVLLGAQSAADLLGQGLVTTHKLLPQIREPLEKKFAWLKEEGDSQRDKRMNKIVHGIFSEEMLTTLDNIYPGLKKSWEEDLKDLLEKAPEDNLRMFLSGTLSGIAVALVQNGEQTFSELGVPLPVDLIFGSKVFLDFLANGIRWTASEKFHNISRNATPLFGASLRQVIGQANLPPELKGKNPEELINLIFEGYIAEDTEQRFLMHLKGFTAGLFAGNLMQGKPVDALFYPTLSLLMQRTVKTNFQSWIKGPVSRVVDSINQARKDREKESAIAEAEGYLISTSWSKSKGTDQQRRRAATLKNTAQYIYSGLMPTLFAWLANYLDPQIGIAGQLYSFSQIAAVITESTQQAATRLASQQNAQQATEEIKNIGKAIVEANQRLLRVCEQELAFMDSEAAIPVIQNLQIKEFINRQDERVGSLNFDRPIPIEAQKVYLVSGGIQTGKTTFIDTLATLTRYKNLFLRVPVENQQAFSLRVNLANIVAHHETQLGKLSLQDRRDLIIAEDEEALRKNPIILRFLEYCRDHDILQGENGITAEWFTRKGFIPSGSQQLLLNTALHFMIKGRKIIMFDDPTGVLDPRAKKYWRYLIDNLLADSDHSVIATTNDFDQIRPWSISNSFGGLIDINALQVRDPDFYNQELDEMELVLLGVGLDIKQIWKEKSKPELLWEDVVRVDPFRLNSLISFIARLNPVTGTTDDYIATYLWHTFLFSPQDSDSANLITSFCAYWNQRGSQGLTDNDLSEFKSQLDLFDRIIKAIYRGAHEPDLRNEEDQFLLNIYHKLQAQLKPYFDINQIYNRLLADYIPAMSP